MHACGQSPAQLHMLGLLNELGPTTVSHLATLLGTTPPSASAMVDRMVDTGLVVRERNEDDRRVVTVSLGPGGKDALEAALGGRREMLERVLSQLTTRSCAPPCGSWPGSRRRSPPPPDRVAPGRPEIASCVM